MESICGHPQRTVDVPSRLVIHGYSDRYVNNLWLSLITWLSMEDTGLMTTTLDIYILSMQL